MRKIIGYSLACVLGLLSAPVAATPAVDCVRLASDPNDPHIVEAGTPLDRILLPDAVIACEQAVAADPNDTASHLHLARALLASEEVDRALEVLEVALEEDYGAAVFLLAQLYLDLTVSTFDRVDDLERAIALLSIAVEGGYPVSDDLKFEVWQEYFSFAFVSEDYRHSDLMQAVWDKTPLPPTREEHLALVVFVENFEELCVDGPDANIANSLQLQFMQNVIRQVQAQENMLPENRRFAQAIFEMNKDAYLNAAALAIRSDAHDAVLFIDRHTCESDVTNTFMTAAYGALEQLLTNEDAHRNMSLALLAHAQYFLTHHRDQFPEYGVLFD